MMNALNRYTRLCITYIYLDLFIDLKLVNRIYLLYRIILIVLSVYCFINNNPYSFLELFSNNYLKELHDDFFVNIKYNLRNRNPFGIGSSNTSDSGPSNPNPNPYTGMEPLFEAENNKKRTAEPLFEAENNKKRSAEPLNSESSKKQDKGKKRLAEPLNSESPKKQDKGKKPMFTFIDQGPKLKELISSKNKHISDNINEESENLSNKKNKHKEMMTRVLGPEPTFQYLNSKGLKVYPESFLLSHPICFFNNNLRIYKEDGMQYTYDFLSDDPTKNFCKIRYPDGSKCFIYDAATLMKNIKFHKDHIKLGYDMKPSFSYNDYYNEHLGRYNKDKVDLLIKKYKEINSNRNIIRKDK